MIKRINLIEKKPFSFTYLKLMQICLVVVLINASFSVYKGYEASNLAKKLKTEKKELIKLEAKRDSLMKKPVKKKISVGQYQGLLDKIENTPNWSNLINEVSQSLPNTVWITNFRSITASSGASKKKKKAPKKKAKKKGKAEKAVVKLQKHGIEVSGLGSDMRNITEFTAKLAGTELLKNLVLSRSEKNTYGFSFTIKGEIKSDFR